MMWKIKRWWWRRRTTSSHLNGSLDVSRGTRTWNMIRLINRSPHRMCTDWQTLQMSLDGNHFSLWISHQHIDDIIVLPRKVHEGVPPTVRQKNHMEKSKKEEIRSAERHKQTAAFTLPAVIYYWVQSAFKSPAEDMSTESIQDWKTSWGSVHLLWRSSSGFSTQLVQLILCITWCFLFYREMLCDRMFQQHTHWMKENKAF